MSVIQNPVIGRARKSAGGMRFGTWRGLNVMASKPISVRQNVTPAVELNRKKMSIVGKAISKINANVNRIYNFGISKTTPFADTVKFFRNRILDTTNLSANLLAGAKFGTGNAEGHQYAIMSTSLASLQLDASVINPIFDDADTMIDVFVVNDSMNKIAYFKEAGQGNGTVVVDLSDAGFIQGDKIAVATKCVKFRPGNDLAGKVKFTENVTFTALTA